MNKNLGDDSEWEIKNNITKKSEIKIQSIQNKITIKKVVKSEIKESEFLKNKNLPNENLISYI